MSISGPAFALAMSVAAPAPAIEIRADDAVALTAEAQPAVPAVAKLEGIVEPAPPVPTEKAPAPAIEIRADDVAALTAQAQPAVPAVAQPAGKAEPAPPVPTEKAPPSATQDQTAAQPTGASSSGSPDRASPAASGEVQVSPPSKADNHGGSGGEIVVTGRQATPADPLVKLNAVSYQAIQAVDDALVGPIAKGYEKVVPKPVRLGVRNFLRNLEQPVIALNFMLQLKPVRAVKSVGRFAINSTVGVAGLVDVAKGKPFNLPYIPNGFANTFACYGIGPGPYFFLPLVGPTTLRDVIGVSLDRFLPPAVVGKPLNRPYYAIPANVIESLNDRVEIDDQLNKIRNQSKDPYVATRELYLKQRKAEIAAICPKKGEVIDKDLPPRAGKGRD